MNFTSVNTVMQLAFGYPLYGICIAAAVSGFMTRNTHFYASLTLISIR